MNLFRRTLAELIGTFWLAFCGCGSALIAANFHASADSGDSWAPIVRDLPPVLSVEVQTLP